MTTHAPCHKERLANGDVAITMPLRWQKKGGRKLVLIPPGAQPLEANPEPRTPDQRRQHYYPLVKALVRAYHWKHQMEKGHYGTLTELARANGLHTRYVWQILQLNFLAPALKAAILEGTQPRHLTLSDFQQGVPPLWSEQEEKWGVAVTPEGALTQAERPSVVTKLPPEHNSLTPTFHR